MRVLLLYDSITVLASSSVIMISAMLIIASVFMLIGSITVIFFQYLRYLLAYEPDGSCGCDDYVIRGVLLVPVMVMI